MYINPGTAMAEQTPDAFKEESACRGWIEAHESVGPCNICSGNVEGLNLRCGFSDTLLEFHALWNQLAAPSAGLFLQGSGRKQISKADRKMPWTDSNATKTTIHFSPPES